MKVIVQKYGGSSVSDIPSIQRVAARIVAAVDQGWRVVVVVSAMGNTTNELLRLAKEVSPEPKRRELDLLISVGERVSMTLLAMAVQQLGYDARSFTGSQSGIITDNRHAAARIIEVRPSRIQKALESGSVAIVAGFQGMSLSKEVTTLGRGGSDASAVALAAALNAEFCEICSDVDGVYSADPRRVSDAFRHDDIDIETVLTAAQRGAKVLQAEALLLAQKMGIKLRANATVNPSGQGTLITPEPQPGALMVALENQVAWLVSDESSVLETFGPHLLYATESPSGFGLLIRTTNFHGQLPENANQTVALLTMLSRRSSVFQALSWLQIQTNVLGWWHSDNGLSVIIESENADYLQSKVHELLVS